ncbi:MAG: cytochrome C oxidase subunit IV family protein [Bacteroidia bacterium]|nr:cytochrome C oxidase subunit IV family protein [Bacteroidia bacterium]
MEFQDNYPQYEIMAHHSEEEGKLKRKKLWKVFWILLVVTLLELFIGSNAEAWGLQHAGQSTFILKVIFIGLTILKAAYIVLSFMHLGDENKMLRYLILVPYSFFIVYIVAICLNEALYSVAYRGFIDSVFFK